MAETPDEAPAPTPERPVPDPPIHLTVEGVERLVIPLREEGEFRKGTYVVPEAVLPEDFVLPSAAPIIENPAVQVEKPSSPPPAPTSKDE
jgi:hypothetical protein